MGSLAYGHFEASSELRADALLQLSSLSICQSRVDENQPLHVVLPQRSRRHHIHDILQLLPPQAC